MRGLVKIGKRLKISVLPDHAGDIAFFPAYEFICGFAGEHIKHVPPFVQTVIVYVVVNAVEAEIHKSRNDCLRALRNEKLFEIVVSERRILDKYLSDDADFDGFSSVHRDIRKIRDYLSVILFYVPVTDLRARAELFSEFIRPAVGKRLSVSSMLFVRTALIDKAEQQIPVNNGVKHTVKFRQSQFEAGVILDPRKAERNDGNIPVSGFFQRFAQQRYVI